MLPNTVKSLGGGTEDASGVFPAPRVDRCLHCGAELGADDRTSALFCCSGCEAVHGLLAAEGLDRYYALRGDRGSAVTTYGKARDHKWLEKLEGAAPGAAAGVRSVSLDVQGIHCAACVWLFEELYRREEGALTLTVNPALGRMEICASPEFDLAGYVERIERFGYLLGPAEKRDEAPAKTSELLVRTGVCIAIAMNAMIFAIAIYAGLDSGPIFKFFHALTFGLATLSVLVGGTVFFRSAWHALRQRVLHLDVPIALGIVLAYTGSAYSLFTHQGAAAYFDTVSVFIALMLVGRFLQERVLERNRHELLAASGASSLLTRVVRDGGASLVPCSEVALGDKLLVAPSDLVPVPSVLESAGASVSLDWINGESAPREVRRGDVVPAGAFNVGHEAVTLVATTAFDASPIVGLLRTTRETASDAARATPWWRLFTRIYVIVVLALAAGAFVTWYALTRDLSRALEVTTAVLVVTCPCAFGIATPMAYELAQAGLRRAGVFVRSASFLDRAVDVRKVVFDKTGTLTTGALTVTNPEAIAALSAVDRRALYDMAARSTHPKSVAVARALVGERLSDDVYVTEVTGAGLELRDANGVVSRLGSAAFALGAAATDGETDDDVVFARGGRALARIGLRESLRSDARSEVAALKDSGYEVFVLSGDASPRVHALADRLGIAADHAEGGQSPEGKAKWLAGRDRGDTMMVGDGLNDGPATEHAFTSATPAVDRPFMPARTDLYFTTAGLRPVRLALAAARALRRVTQRNLAVAIAYNVLTVGLAYAGLMTPLLCAIVMPASSLSIVLATLASLSPRSALWRS